MTCEFKELDTQLSKFIREFYFYNQLARHIEIVVVVVFIILTMTNSRQINLHYAKNKYKIVKPRSTVEPEGYLSQGAPSSFNSNHKQSITAQFRRNS